VYTTGDHTMVVAGTRAGKVTIGVRHEECSGDAATIVVEIGSGTCSSEGCKSVGQDTIEGRGLYVSFSLGRSGPSMSAGSLFIRSEEPLAGLFTPAMLQISAHPATVTELADTATGALRQVVAPEALVDIQDQLSGGRTGYAISFYVANTQRNRVPGTSYYSVSGETPFVTYEIENPDPLATDALIVRKVQGGNPVKIYRYDYVQVGSGLGWALSIGDGQNNVDRYEMLINETLSGTQRRETYAVYEPDLATKRYEERRTYTKFTCGSETIER